MKIKKEIYKNEKRVSIKMKKTELQQIKVF